MSKCPACRSTGQGVKRVTLDSLLLPEQRGRITDEPYYVCTRPGCDTVYFCPSDGRAFARSDLGVRFGLKETESPRPVCYCFDHSVEEIEDEIRRTGRSTVVERIRSDMKGPGCRCEQTNPLGACCLKSVRDVVADALEQAGQENEAATVARRDDGDCCTGNGGASTQEELTTVGCAMHSETDNQKVSASADCCQPLDAVVTDSGHGRSGALAAVGSLVSAVLSSACCWLPLLLITFGASAAGVAGFFEAYRPYFVAGAVVMLSFGFYSIYFRKAECKPGSVCAAPTRKLRVFNKVMLWTATALVGAFVFFPNYVGAVLGSSSPPNAQVGDTGLTAAMFQIEGMTCEGCANTLRAALTKVPGVKVADVIFAKKIAVVRFAPESPVPSERIIKAVKAAGYEATLPDPSRLPPGVAESSGVELSHGP